MVPSSCTTRWYLANSTCALLFFHHLSLSCSNTLHVVVVALLLWGDGVVDGFCFSVYTMNGEAYLGGAMSGEAFWDGVHGRSKSQFQGARYNILSISICSP
jgi:hypothetical protein